VTHSATIASLAMLFHVCASCGERQPLPRPECPDLRCPQPSVIWTRRLEASKIAFTRTPTATLDISAVERDRGSTQSVIDDAGPLGRGGETVATVGVHPSASAARTVNFLRSLAPPGSWRDTSLACEYAGEIALIVEPAFECDLGKRRI
jgi:hypothetical protein